MILVARTKKIAKFRGLSLREVAQKANIGDNAIYRWDTNNPRSETLKKVADVLDVSIDCLLERTEMLNIASHSPEKIKKVNIMILTFH